MIFQLYVICLQLEGRQKYEHKIFSMCKMNDNNSFDWLPGNYYKTACRPSQQPTFEKYRPTPINIEKFGWVSFFLLTRVPILNSTHDFESNISFVFEKKNVITTAIRH